MNSRYQKIKKKKFNKTNVLPCATEEQEQAALIQWANTQWFGQYLFAIPNGGLRNKITAKKLKGQGVRAGVPDLFLAIPSPKETDSNEKIYNGLFIEMKRKKKSTITSKQKHYIKLLYMKGYAVIVAYGWQEASEGIINYLSGKYQESLTGG